MDRRTFLKRLVQGMGLAVAGVAGLPALIGALSPAIQYRRDDRWRPIGSLEQFPVGETTRAEVDVDRDDRARSVRAKGVYVWRPAADQVVVFSRNCTDLSCPITWDPGSAVFVCPCHGGIFARDGTVKAGPPSRPLYRYANRVRDGVLEIDLQSLPPMT